MTVSATNARTVFTGTGTTGAFTTGIDVSEASEYRVTKWEIADPTNVTELTLNAGSNGFTVNASLTTITLTEALTSSYKIAITRSINKTQETDLQNGQAFPLQTIEDMADKLTLIVQDGFAEVDRAIQFTNASNLTFPVEISGDPEDGQVLVWNDTDAVLQWEDHTQLNFEDVLTVAGVAANAARIRLAEDTDNGTNYIEIKAPASIASNQVFVLPSADGTSGQFLKTDGSGNLSFASQTTYSEITSASASGGTSFKFYEDTDNGTNYVALKGADSIASDVTFKLPSADGSSNQVLKTDGSGNLGFASVGSLGGNEGWTEVKSETSFSGSSAVGIDLSSGSYRYLKVVINFTTNATATHRVRVSTDNGATGLSGSNYSSGYDFGGGGVSGSGGNSSGATTLSWYSSDSGVGVNVEMILTDFNTASKIPGIGYKSISYNNYLNGVGNYNSAGTYNGIQFYPSTGTITGKYTVYGRN